jgi:hypothetical protein
MGMGEAPDVREAVRPLIAQEARAASFLADTGIALNTDAYALFVDAVADNLPYAFTLLERRARGDYPYKRSCLVALRGTKISASDAPSIWWPGER